MKLNTDIEKIILKKLHSIPQEKTIEVLNFIDFISTYHRAEPYKHLMLKAQQISVSKNWDDPALDIYND